ncbi:MAG: nitroreductase family protein [Candidatus Dormibacterales bacterium]
MVHRFTSTPVDRELLLRVLEVARHSPSAGFSQGFELLVLDEPRRLDRFWHLTEHPEHPYEAEELHDRPPCIVLAIANKPAYLERYSRPDKAPFGLQKEDAWPVPYWDVDTGMAVMLVLLAAVEAGLGAWFFGLAWGIDDLMRELEVPVGCRPIGAIGIGYAHPEEKPRGSAFSIRRRPLDAMVHFGSWTGGAGTP